MRIRLSLMRLRDPGPIYFGRDKAKSSAANELITGDMHMKRSANLCLIVPLALAGCVEAPPPVTTTTEVTRTVTTTGPGPVTREVLVTRAPPVVRVETQTVSPGSSYVWTRGYWRWTGADYVWVPGSWVVRPRVTAVWVEGHWMRRSDGWVWIAGHWR